MGIVLFVRACGLLSNFLYHCYQGMNTADEESYNEKDAPSDVCYVMMICTVVCLFLTLRYVMEYQFIE